MNKFMQKLSCAVIASAMIMTMMAGCGGTKKESQNKDAANAQTPQSTAPVEIKIPVYERGNQGQPKAEDNFWTKWMAEKALKDINVKITYVPIPRTTDIDKFNMLLAANDAPDVIFSYDYPVITSWYGRGVFQEIPKNLIDKYAPDFVKYVGEDTMKYGVVSGKQMYLPARRPLSFTPAGGVIRQDWLDKIGMKNPTSTDEFVSVLKAFKEKDPGGVGSNNVIPFALSLKTVKSCVENYGFRSNPVDEQELALYSDVQIAALTWQPEKERLQFYNKLYNEGLVTPEWALDKDNKKAEADFMNSKSGVIKMSSGPISADPPILQTVVKNVPTAKFAILDTGSYTKPGNKVTARDYWPFGMLSGINKSCKNPEAVLKFFDWMSKTENLNTLQNGIEGKNYTMKDGVPIPVPGFKGDESLLNGTGKDYWCLVAEGKDTGDEKQNLKVETVQRAPAGFEYLWQQQYDQVKKQNRYPDFLFSEPVTTTTKYVKTLDAKWEEAVAKLIHSKPSDFESVYAQVTKDYLSSGYQEIINEKKKLYEAQKAKK